MCLMFVMFGLDVWMRKKNAAFKRILEDGTPEILKWCRNSCDYLDFMGDFCIFYHGEFLLHTSNVTLEVHEKPQEEYSG